MFAAMGKSPEPLAKMLLKEMDSNIDLDQLLKDAQVILPPVPQQEQQRPPSLALSMNFKDAPPEVQQQIEGAFGFKPAPPASHLIEKVGHGAAIAAHHQNANPQPPAQPAGNQRP